MSDENTEKNAPPPRSSSLVLSATQSQRLAVEEFVRSPISDNWEELVGILRQRPVARAAASPMEASLYPDLVDEDSGPPLPIGLIQETLLDATKDTPSRALDLIEDENAGPVPEILLDYATTEDSVTVERKSNRVLGLMGEDEDEDAGPGFLLLEESPRAGVRVEACDKKKFKKKMAAPAASLDYTSQGLELPRGTNDNAGTSSPRHDDNLASQQADSMVHHTAVEHDQPTPVISEAIIETRSREESMHVIPEAFLVDNEDVVIGTPVTPQLPWHKERRTRLLLAVVCVIVVVLSIALAVNLSSDGNAAVESSALPPSPSLSPSSLPSEIPSSSPAPSTTNLPSLSPSFAASVSPSQYPSLFPSMTSSPTANLIALFETGCDNCWPVVAIYGDTAVVARGFIDIQFFSLTNNSAPKLTTTINFSYDPTDIDINGNTAVIGSMSANRDIGAAFVFEKNQNGTWYQVVRLEPRDFHSEGGVSGSDSFISGGPYFGRSVAIYGDVIIVGADDDGEKGVGAAYIFRRNDTSWVEEAKITPPNSTLITPPPNSTAEGLGYSVSIKGNTAVVADIAHGDMQEGAVFVYEYEPSSNFWNQSEILISVGCSYFFGSFVRLTNDEELLVGCEGSNSVYYYEKQGLANEYLLQQSIEFNGIVTSIEIDGDTMIVSEDREGISNIVHFFVRENHVWQQVYKIDEPAFDEGFGNRAASSGNLTLVASEQNVYLLSVGQYPSLFPTTTSSSPMGRMNALVKTDCDYCWPEVAIYGDTAVVARGDIDIQFFSLTNTSTFELIATIDSGYRPSATDIDGNTAVIGSSDKNSEIGAVFVYEKAQNGTWFQVVRLEPRDFHSEGGVSGSDSFISGGPLFGRSVAIYGDIIIVGADDDGEKGEGAAYIFRRNETSWVEEAKITPPPNSTAEGFGYSVSIKGDIAVIGDIAYGDDLEGAVFVYEYESLSKSWNQSGRTVMSNDCGSFFGSFVRLTNDEELLVGCQGSNSVYYYEKQGVENEYLLQQSIAFDGSIVSIEIDRDTMIVSEDREDISNAIHFFVRENHVWQLVYKIDEPTFDASFGNRVASFGNVTLVASAKNVYHTS